jgi:hypothetical protein
MAGSTLSGVWFQLKVLGLGEVAVYTGRLGWVLICLAKLDNAGMGVVTVNTIEGGVLTLEEVFIFFAVND